MRRKMGRVCGWAGLHPSRFHPYAERELRLCCVIRKRKQYASSVLNRLYVRTRLQRMLLLVCHPTPTNWTPGCLRSPFSQPSIVFCGLPGLNAHHVSDVCWHASRFISLGVYGLINMALVQRYWPVADLIFVLQCVGYALLVRWLSHWVCSSHALRSLSLETTCSRNLFGTRCGHIRFSLKKTSKEHLPSFLLHYLMAYVGPLSASLPLSPSNSRGECQASTGRVKAMDCVVFVTSQAAVIYLVALAVLYKLADKCTTIILVLSATIAGQFLFLDWMWVILDIPCWMISWLTIGSTLHVGKMSKL